ncbi:MAG: hypothetical protein ACOXZR_02700 [Bacilli bacterium]
MPKYFILLVIVFILLTGCSVKKVDLDEYEDIIETVLYQERNLFNRVSNGYKYYLPRGVVLGSTNQFNEQLYAKEDRYYLYINIVSYYFNKTNDYVFNDKIDYSKKLAFKDKQGYLEIKSINDKYFIKMVYNHAEIESIVSKENIKQTLINFSYILSSLKFNKNVVQLAFNKDAWDSTEKTFNIFESKRTEGNFLDYVKRYDVYEEEIEDLILSEWDIIE